MHFLSPHPTGLSSRFIASPWAAQHWGNFPTASPPCGFREVCRGLHGGGGRRRSWGASFFTCTHGLAPDADPGLSRWGGGVSERWGGGRLADCVQNLCFSLTPSAASNNCLSRVVATQSLNRPPSGWREAARALSRTRRLQHEDQPAHPIQPVQPIQTPDTSYGQTTPQTQHTASRSHITQLPDAQQRTGGRTAQGWSQRLPTQPGWTPLRRFPPGVIAGRFIGKPDWGGGACACLLVCMHPCCEIPLQKMPIA